MTRGRGGNGAEVSVNRMKLQEVNFKIIPEMIIMKD